MSPRVRRHTLLRIIHSLPPDRMPRGRRKQHTHRSLIAGHLRDIKRALLEGEKRSAFLEFLKQNLPAKQGIYALYDKRGRLYYAGKASDLARRLNQHLR